MIDATHTLDWRHAALNPDILQEAGVGDGRLVLWLPTERDGDRQCWERISTMPHAAVMQNEGLCAVAATAIRARQRVRHRFSSLLRCFHRNPSADCDWLLPNGEVAEQYGDRQTDLLLIWTKEQGQPLDATRIQALWPESTRVQPLGRGLFLLFGIMAPIAASASETRASEDSCLEQAAHCLAVARQKGNRADEASALTDLGLAALEDGNASLAIARLEEALVLARILEDPAREGDILGNLGLAALLNKHAEQARLRLEQSLILARTLGDRFAEKLTLERLATVHASQGDMRTAITLLGESLSLARTLSDRQHEAELLWHLAIRQAELGRRELALRDGQAAVQLLERLSKPQAGIYKKHLEQYRREGAGTSGLLLTTDQMLPKSTPPAHAGPGYLQMAISAARALVQFIGSGLERASDQMFRERLQWCAECTYHTGLRCRICGCFTNIKARLPHEECPVGHWQALAVGRTQ